MKLFVSANKKKYKTSTEFAAICLAEYSGLNACDFQIRKDEYGKPFCSAPFHFSLSHSGSVIMCAVDEYNLGLDCQFVNRDYTSCLKIAGRFYHDEEIKILGLSSSEDEYVDLFFEIWTKKEAYVKFTGRGLADGLKKFNSMDDKHERNFLVFPYKDEIKSAIYSANPNKVFYTERKGI